MKPLRRRAGWILLAPSMLLLSLRAQNVPTDSVSIFKLNDQAESLSGEADIHGRKAWVLDFTPKKDHVPANQHEKDVFTTRGKTWIDEAENLTLKSVILVVGDGSLMMPGTSITIRICKDQ